MLKFNEMALHEVLLKNLNVQGHLTPTPIQAEAIPFLLEGYDLLGIAQTGTGKTAAFSLPIIQHLLNKPLKREVALPRILILSPTRELCSQIHTSIMGYAQDLHLRSCAIYGGVGQGEQVRALKDGVDIVVATPGRLLDLIEQRHLRLSKVEIFVLDEADRMLDMGFIDDIKSVIHRLPSVRQTMLFSATMPDDIADLAGRMLKNPKRVEVTPVSSTVDKIQQKVIYCKKNDKFQLLKKIIKEEETELVLVFTRTKNVADNVAEYLAQNRMPSKVIHGDRSQAERESALDHFKNGVIKVLIATDIASRGLDVPGVSHVINFDLPREAESYVHRIGRTARAGKEGKAISFCDDSEKNFLEKIQQLIQLYLPSEKYEGKFEVLKFKGLVGKVTAPTPGKSQEKSAYLDHSKRQKVLGVGEKRQHPGFKKTKKRR